MIEFTVERWAAIAPGITTARQWLNWLEKPVFSEQPLVIPKESLQVIPPMLRRRLSPFGKAMLAAAVPLLNDKEPIPVIFGSQYGDSVQTLRLLQNLGREEPLSPAGFSLSVHNAIAGILSIARKDSNPITALAATENLLLNACFEIYGQLQRSPKILCILGDQVLPDLYQQAGAQGPRFTHALALICSRESNGIQLSISPQDEPVDRSPLFSTEDALGLLPLLTGFSSQISLGRSDSPWFASVRSGGILCN